MEIGPFFQCEEPDEGADDKDANSIYQQCIVQNNKSDGNVSPLNDRPDGYYEGND